MISRPRRIASAGLALAILPGCTPRHDTRTTIPTEGFIDGGSGVRIFYRAVGTGPETIVVVHGGPGGDFNTIAPNLGPLTQRHRVVYYDQRGGGRSGLPQDTSLLEARYFVQDLEAVRQHFGIERLNLLAHSFGAVVAARYLEEHPDRVARMLFLKPVATTRTEAGAVATGAYGRSEAGTRLQQVVTSLLDGTAPDPVATCREFERIEAAIAAPHGETTAWRGSGCDVSPEVVRYEFRNTARITADSFGDWDFTRSLTKSPVPLLVVAGDRDPSLVPIMHGWAAAVPNGRALIVPGVGNGVPADRPQVFFPAAEAFFSGRWPEAAVGPRPR